MREVLSVVAGFVFVFAFIPYIRAILRGETRPSKASWLIWASIDTITIAGMYSAGTVNGQIVGAFCGAWTVAILAMRYGTSGWTKLDKVSLGGAIAGIILWYIFSSPVIGIISSLVVGFIGSVPTFAAAWSDPAREDRVAWTLFWISCVIALGAVPQCTLADAAQPSTFFLIETIMMYILYFRPRRKL